MIVELLNTINFWIWIWQFTGKFRLIFSGMVRNKWNNMNHVIMCWVGFASVISILDLLLTIILAVDYTTLSKSFVSFVFKICFRTKVCYWFLNFCNIFFTVLRVHLKRYIIFFTISEFIWKYGRGKCCIRINKINIDSLTAWNGDNWCKWLVYIYIYHHHYIVFRFWIMV